MRLLPLLLTIGLVATSGCEKKDDAPAPANTAAKPATAGDAPKPTGDAPKAPTTPPKPVEAPTLEMAPIDLSGDGFAASMQAPKGATFADSFGTLEVKLDDGKDFFVQIDTEAPDMAKVKASVLANDVQKLQKFHTETDDVLIYETLAFGKTSFWMDAAIKVGDKTVHCYSGRGAPSFTQPQVEMFLAACKSLQPKG